MDFTKLIEDVIVRSKPVRPSCPVCKGQMSVAEWGSDGQELLVCNKIKPTNQRGDNRVYDPQHYEKSKTRSAIGIDVNILRKNLGEAFGKVEAEAEQRVREELAKSQQQEKPAQTERPSKKKADVPVQNA